MYNLRRTIRTITKAPKFGVFTAIGAVIALTMLLAACPEDPPPAGPAGPTAPANLVVEINDSRAILTWDAVDGATEYRIYRAGPDGTLTRIAEGVTVTETTFIDTDLTNGTEYRYVVRAVNSDGESGDSEEIMLTSPALWGPVNLAVEINDSRAILTWDAVDGAEEYRVYRASPDEIFTRIASNTTITETTFTDTGLVNGTEYRYRVRAVDSADGESSDSAEVTATPALIAPLAPTNLTATPGSNQVLLSWDAVDGAAEYRVFSSFLSSGALPRIAVGVTITDPTYTDTNLINGFPYRYAVRAVNRAGESPSSDEVTATPAASVTAPAAPGNLSATAGNAEVSLLWDAVDGATEYQIYRADTANGVLTRIASSVTINTVNYTDTGLVNGTTYRYTVRASNSVGESSDSSEVTATPAVPVPAAPANLTATAVSARVSLSWDAADDAAEYRVYRKITVDGTLTRIGSTAATSYADTGLTNGTTYRYVVRAANTAGESPDSNEASATPNLPAPENLTATAGTAQVLLSWDAVTRAAEYRIYRAATADGTLTRIAENITITTTSYTDADLAGGTAYRYVVRSVSGAAESPNSNEASAATPAVPAAPANLSATLGNTQVSLTWDEVDNAAEYYVYRAPRSSFAVFVRIADSTTITDASYTDTGLTAGDAFRYVVRAVNSNGESLNSDIVTVTVITVPSVPANLRATVADAAVALSWDAVAGAAQYRIYRAATANGTLTRIAGSTTITDTAYTDTGLTNSTAYRYTVRAVNAAGESADSSEVSATPAAVTTVPAAPANLSFITGAVSVILSWDAVAGATEYRVYRAATADGTLTRIDGSTTITDITYTDTSVTNGVAYRYAVRAVNAIGESIDSSEVTARPDDHGSARAAATPITPGTAVSAAIARLQDVDYFSFDVTVASEPVSITAVSTFSISDDDVNIQGTIYNSAGTELASNANYDINGNFLVRTTVTESGTYYLRVSDNRVISLGLAGNYSFMVTLSEADDHGDTGIHATPITPNFAINGSINSAADHDYFSFTVTTATPVVVAAYTTGATFAAEGTVFTSTGTELSESFIPESNDFISITSITASGTYYLRVRSEDEAATGDYTLTILDPAADHSGMRAGATTVTSGTRIEGFISDMNDSDYFGIAVTASSSDPVTIHAITTGYTDTIGQIFRSTGSFSIANNDNHFSDGVLTANFRVSARVTASGTYYVRVYGRLSVTSLGPYSLTVTLSPQLPVNPSVIAGDAQATLSWDASDRAAEYWIYRAATASGTLTRIAEDTTITGTTYTDTGLTNGTAYRYRVRAVNVAGESADSAEVTATPTAP